MCGNCRAYVSVDMYVGGCWCGVSDMAGMECHVRWTSANFVVAFLTRIDGPYLSWGLEVKKMSPFTFVRSLVYSSICLGH